MASNVKGDTKVRRFWNEYARSAGVRRRAPAVVSFGDTDELADEFAWHVLSGKKRAHASLWRDFGAGRRPMPKRGDFTVIVDGARTPRCIIRCVDVEIKSMGQVDERFAWDAGGGDRSLRWWLAAHSRYFKRQGDRENFSVTPETELVLERFEVVWPPAASDLKMNDPSDRGSAEPEP